MSIPRTTRRSLLGTAALGSLGAAGLSACGTSGPGGSSGGGDGPSASMWALSGQPDEQIQTDAVEAFNELGDGTIEVTFYENDAYKTKIRTAVGAGQAPTLIYGWGGGILKSYADADQVVDLTDWVSQTSEMDRFVDAAWGSATFDDQIYAVPADSAQPILMFYNTKLFDQAGADLPQTWDDVMNLVDVFNGRDVAPFALGGQSLWTSMMWLEFLYDRIGGPEVFDAIFAGEPDSWSHPAAIEAGTMIQDLVKANGFVKGYATIAADSNADQALLYTDKAAMMLHGGWCYGSMKNDGGDFVQNYLDYATFPTVEGGEGDPKNSVGNPAQYWSISAGAGEEEQQVAKAFLTEGILTDAEIRARLETGAVPVVKDAKEQIPDSPDPEYLEFVYNTINGAPNFQQSWDQALSPNQASELLNNIGQLFLNKITPEKFADNMNATIEQS